MNRKRRGQADQKQQPIYPCEADVVEGLEAIALDEIRGRFGRRVRFHHPSHPSEGVFQFNYQGDLRELLQLKTIRAIYLVQHFAMPRPRALLGHQNFQALLKQIDIVRNLLPGSFKSFYLSAAGSDSRIMLRLKDELAQHTGLKAASSNDHDLLLRLRHPLSGAEGWEALIRLSPRPLSARGWRVCDYEGAVNATVAHAMALLVQPSPDDLFLNIACGSGTLLIERRICAPASQMIGCDIDPDALECARTNIFASGYSPDIQLHAWDARSLPLRNSSIDVLCTDLPFGALVGSHAENVVLYPLILKEAARVAKPNARFILLTHEVRLMESLLDQSSDWRAEKVLRIMQGGLHPRIFLLRKR